MKTSSKQKIIVDTNIWYEIGKGNIHVPNKNEYKLISTYTNLEELTGTYNLMNNPGEVQAALKNLYRHQSLHIKHIHLVHIIRQAHVSYDDSFMQNHYKGIEDFGDKLLHGKILESDSFADWFGEIAEGRQAGKEEFTNYIMEGVKQVRKNFKEAKKDGHDKYKHRSFDSTALTKSFITHFVYSWTFYQRNPYRINDDYPWHQIELLYNVIDRWFKDLELSKQKIAHNDWQDIFTLSYVQPGDLVWTIDKGLRNKIIDAGMDKYLFQP